MTLPPLANLFGVHLENPAALAEIGARLRRSGEFDEVWTPAPGWVAASAALPGGEPDGPAVKAAGLAFAEGRDRLVPHAAGNGRLEAERVARLADENPERLDTLPGDFGFIRFRPHGGATVVRSCAGRVPFYVSRQGVCTVVTTLMGHVVRYGAQDLRLDTLPCAVWAARFGWFPDGRTFFRDVSAVPRGGFMRLQAGREPGVDRYWNPRPSEWPRPSEAAARDRAVRLREHLVSVLRRELDPGGANLLALSGGVDSTSLAALATRTLGIATSTWSLLPDPDDQFQREMRYVELAASHPKVRRRFVTRLTAQGHIELLENAPSVVFPVAHPFLCDLPRVLPEEPVVVLWGGEFADQVCGSFLTVPDWATAMPFAALIRGGRGIPLVWLRRWIRFRIVRLLRRNALPFPTRLPNYLTKEVRAEYAEWASRMRHDFLEDRQPWKFSALGLLEDQSTAMNWETASTLGLRRFYPFLDRENLELMFGSSPRDLVVPDTKRLLRRALEEVVPNTNLYRPDKGHWGRYLREAKVKGGWRPPPELHEVFDGRWWTRRDDAVDRSAAAGAAIMTKFMYAIRDGRAPEPGPILHSTSRLSGGDYEGAGTFVARGKARGTKASL